MMRRFAAIGLMSAVVSLAMAGQVAGQAERPRSHAPRTPWGAPDLNGTWTGSTLTPLERPKEFTGKAVLAPEEAAALEARARERNAREPQAGPGDPGTYNQIWFDPSSAVVPDRRTSLIVDPPDGRLPFTPEGRELAVRHSSHYGTGPRDNPEDLDTGERCLTDGVPIPYWTGYNNNYQIVQTPQHVMIRSEMYHNVRVIPLDGRARNERSRNGWASRAAAGTATRSSSRPASFADKLRTGGRRRGGRAGRRCAWSSASLAPIARRSTTSSR